MDIQKIITEVIAKLQGDNSLLKDFALNPADIVKKIANIDLNDEQIKQIIEAVKSKIDLSKIVTDQEAFLAQKDTATGAKTMKAYLWRVCGEEYDAQHNG